MKKLCALLVVLCVLIGCVGCAVNEPGTDKNELSNNSFTDSTSPKDSHDVPFILYFDSFEHISELKSMLEEDESTVDEYLRDNQYYMNGLKSKNDINGLFDDIGDLNMLHLDSASGYSLAGITYYVSYGYIMSTYKNDNDIVRFICYINNGNLEDNISEPAELKTAVIGNMSIGNKTLGLHSVDDEKSQFALASSIETENSQITLLFTEDNDDVIQAVIGDNVVEAPLSAFLIK